VAYWEGHPEPANEPAPLVIERTGVDCAFHANVTGEQVVGGSGKSTHELHPAPQVYFLFCVLLPEKPAPQLTVRISFGNPVQVHVFTTLTQADHVDGQVNVRFCVHIPV